MFRLLCCGQVLHDACVCALCAQDPEPRCPCCRRLFNDGMEEAAATVIRSLWEGKAQRASRFVLLSPDGHAEFEGDMGLVTAGGVCKDTFAQLVEWSPEGDDIHAFVAKFCAGRWPMPGESWADDLDWRLEGSDDEA